MEKTQKNPLQAREVLKFFDWCFRQGSEAAKSLDYVAMPEAVVKMVNQTWQHELRDPAGKPLWP